jgi:hypothetical protein
MKCIIRILEEKYGIVAYRCQYRKMPIELTHHQVSRPLTLGPFPPKGAREAAAPQALPLHDKGPSVRGLHKKYLFNYSHENDLYKRLRYPGIHRAGSLSVSKKGEFFRMIGRARRFHRDFRIGGKQPIP